MFFFIVIAFIGYVLPCTQMSFWGLTVFSNILTTVPIIGLWICYWIWGCEFIQDFTLFKVHSLHIVFPFLLLFVVLCHFFCLHYFMSSDGFCDRFAFYVERLFFYMWYLLRDLFFLYLLFGCLFYVLLIWWYFVFHEESWLVCNVLQTPDKVIPEWFFFCRFLVF